MAWVVPRVACSLQLCKTTTAPATTLNASSTVPVVATSLALSMRESAMGISLPLLLLLLLLLAVAALPLALLRRSNTSFVKDVYLMETTLSCHYPFASTALMPTASGCFTLQCILASFAPASGCFARRIFCFAGLKHEGSGQSQSCILGNRMSHAKHGTAPHPQRPEGPQFVRDRLHAAKSLRPGCCSRPCCWSFAAEQDGVAGHSCRWALRGTMSS